MARMLLTLAALLLVAAPARASVPVPPAASYTIHYEPCPDGSGGPCAYYDTGDIYLARTGSRAGDRHARWHELGHVYLERLSDYWKGALVDRLGYPAGTPWQHPTGDDCYPFGEAACPSEVAADAYAMCALGIPARRQDERWRTSYWYWPSNRSHRRICAVIRRTA
jgi:hypothetical protein